MLVGDVGDGSGCERGVLVSYLRLRVRLPEEIPECLHGRCVCVAGPLGEKESR